jgi:hypothetical protein
MQEALLRRWRLIGQAVAPCHALIFVTDRTRRLVADVPRPSSGLHAKDDVTLGLVRNDGISAAVVAENCMKICVELRSFENRRLVGAHTRSRLTRRVDTVSHKTPPAMEAYDTSSTLREHDAVG